MDFVKLFAEVGGLSIFIFASVAQLKQFGLAGKWLTASAFAIGLIVGGAYRYFIYLPAAPTDWFWLVMFGAAGGFIATGVYKGAESVTGKKPVPQVRGITPPEIHYHDPYPAQALSEALGEAIDREERKRS